MLPWTQAEDHRTDFQIGKTSPLYTKSRCNLVGINVIRGPAAPTGWRNS